MNILLTDDDALVCTSLKIILEADPDIKVVGIGHDGEDAVRLFDELEPDILLMDIRMKNMLGTEAAVKILEKHPDANILFLTTFSDDEYVYTALNCGAKGYLLKQDYESILPAVKAVGMGQSVFGGEVVKRLPSMLKAGEAKAGGSGTFNGREYDLTEKECEIVELVADGLSNREISEKLFLGEGTVRNYISTILEKLGLRDRTQLAVFYYKNR